MSKNLGKAKDKIVNNTLLHQLKKKSSGYRIFKINNNNNRIIRFKVMKIFKTSRKNFLYHLPRVL